MNENQTGASGIWQRIRQAAAWKKVVAVVLVVVLILAVAVGCVYKDVGGIFDTGEAGKLHQVTDEDIEAGGERFYNLLLLGIDYDADDSGRDYAEGKGNTDVILYVQVNRDNGKVNVLQIPRDSYIGDYIDEAKGCTSPTGKINSVYALGPDQDNLINNIANKIYEMFKLPVDNYVTIDMNAFKTMLNVMGGVTMYVPWDITDKTTGELLVPQGTHQISGDTAEVILRNRNYAQADYKRLETQQYFYAALVRTFLQEYDLADYYKACKNVVYYINTDLDLTEIYGLYATMTKVNPSDIYIVRLPGGGYDYTPAFGSASQSGYALDRDAVAALLNEHFREADHPVEAEKLEIPTDVEWLYGVTNDPGKTLGDVNSGDGTGETPAA